MGVTTKDEALAALDRLHCFAYGLGPDEAETATLRQYIESTARDVERYQRLRRSLPPFNESHTKLPLICDMLVPYVVGFTADGLDAAIDAAIAQKDKP